MCAKDCGACPDCRETDEWIVPDDLKRPPTASTSGPESDAIAIQAPVDPPPRERASTARHICRTALTRDGGEPQ